MRADGAMSRGRPLAWTIAISSVDTDRATDCRGMPASTSTWIPGAPGEGLGSAKYRFKGCPRDRQNCAYTHESIEGSHGAATRIGRSANLEARGNRVGAQSHYAHGLPALE